MIPIVTLPPLELQDLKGWLLWRLEANPDPTKKPRKVPYWVNGRRRQGQQGSDEDRGQLTTYQDAVRAWAWSDDWAGLGLAMLPEWGVVGLDFDNCVDLAGDVAPEVADLVRGTYVEWSPSGDGIHAFMIGQYPNAKSHANDWGWGFETFSTNGFLTWTGRPVPGLCCPGESRCSLDILSDKVVALAQHRFGGVDRRHPGAREADVPPLPMSQEGVTRALFHIPVPDARPPWLAIGMALHHQSRGERWGLELFDKWSSMGKTYAGRMDIEGRWKSFKAGGGVARKDRAPITFNHVMGMLPPSDDWAEDISAQDIGDLVVDAPATSGATGMVLQGAAGAMGVSGATGIEVPADAAPMPTFSRDRKEGILATVTNALRACARPDICGYRIAFDEFKADVCVAQPGTNEWRPMKDEDVTLIRERLEGLGFNAAPKELVRDACIVIAARNVFDSATMWLTGLQWDGIPRVATFMSVYMGCDDSPYAQAVAKYLWTALAGRVLVPGVKADMVPILTGHQGMVKTSAIEAIVPSDEFYVEIDLAEAEEKTVRKMRGALIGEIAELSGLHTRDREAIKKFVTRKVEKWVPKYREFTTSFRRRLVFVGTSNRTDILDDDTGNRRWLPIEVLRMAWLAGIIRDRDQFWAEAAAMFRARGVMWQDAEALAPVEHEKFNMVNEDLWFQRIESWLFDVGDLDSGSGPRSSSRFTTADVAQGALGLSVDKLNRLVSNRICAILRLLGFENHVLRKDGRNARMWVLPVA